MLLDTQRSEVHALCLCLPPASANTAALRLALHANAPLRTVMALLVGSPTGVAAYTTFKRTINRWVHLCAMEQARLCVVCIMPKIRRSESS